MHDITYAGLCGWSKSLFENFGWMILSSKNGDVKSIVSYKEEIETLLEYVIEKLEYLYKLQQKERNILIEDKINDMKILKNNLESLQKFSAHLMKQNNRQPIAILNENENIFVNVGLKKKSVKGIKSMKKRTSGKMK